MLNKIRIQNLAIIEDIEIVFDSSFTALTGETGAGKSLVIDSLKLIFGKRADSDYIRYGEDEAVVVAYFSNLNENIKDYLKFLNVNEENLVIERWISRKDKNKVLINDKLSTLGELRELGALIGDIHEQHDTTKLLDPNTALNMIDEFSNNTKLVNEFVILRYEYLNKLKKYEEALKVTEKNQQQLDFYKFSYEELSKANLDINEKDALNIKINTLSNQKEIIESLKEAYLNLKEIDDKNLLFSAFGALEKIKDIHPKYSENKHLIENSYYELEEVKNNLYNELDIVEESSISELEEALERFHFISDLEKKYQKSIEELILYKDNLEEEILKIENYDDFIGKLEKSKDEAYRKTLNKALEISKKRKATSLLLEKEFILILKRLDILYVDFKVEFSKKELSEDGIDEVGFLISLNEGEPLKPFYKVASGGELSRSMLALKILFANIHDLSLMVFDEIDLGISGDAASKVAEELYKLSEHLQVISITHLPQIAAVAKKHFNIGKRLIGGRTITSIEDLNLDERVYHLAYMLSGKTLTEGAILHAKSLLDNKKSPKA